MPLGFNPKLDRLIEWQYRPQVDRMLDIGESPDRISRWMEKMGFKISVPTLYNYKAKRNEAILRDITIDRLLYEEKLNLFTPVKDDVYFNAKHKVKSDLEVLDKVVQKGMDWMRQNPDSYLTVNYALRAIELKTKITENKMGGMTLAGLDEYRAITEGRMSAMLEVCMGYIDESIHDQVLNEMLEAEKKFMEANGLAEQLEIDEDVMPSKEGV